jgi:hypothetical protein
MTTGIIDDAIANMAELIDLELKKVGLLRELRRGLILCKLLGRAPREVKGPMRAGCRRGDSTFFPWRGARFSIQVGNEPEVLFDLKNVPRELWDDDLRAQYEREERRRAKHMATP